MFIALLSNEALIIGSLLSQLKLPRTSPLSCGITRGDDGPEKPILLFIITKDRRVWYPNVM